MPQLKENLVNSEDDLHAESLWWFAPPDIEGYDPLLYAAANAIGPKQLMEDAARESACRSYSRNLLKMHGISPVIFDLYILLKKLLAASY